MQYIESEWSCVSSKKGLMSLVLFLTIFFFFPSMTDTVNAQRSESELRRERSEVQTELEEKREELAEMHDELVELEEEIDSINDVIKNNEVEIEHTEVDIEEKEAEIDVLEEEIERVEVDIQRRNDILKDRASALQRNGGSISYIDVLFGAKSFSDFIDRVSYVTKITQSDQNLIEHLQADKDKVAEQRQVVEDKLTVLEDVILELEPIRELTLDQKDELEVKQEKLEKSRKKSEALIKELEIEDLELERMITAARQRAARERAARQARQTATQFSSNSRASATPTFVGTGNLNTVINAGSHWNGGSNTRYKYAGGRTAHDIQHGLFDCSSFVSWAFSQAGVNVPMSTNGLAVTGRRVSVSEMRPGDMVFFNTYKTNGHVGIYLGNGQFRGAQSSTGVAIDSMNSSYWAPRFTGHVRRVIN